MKKHELWPRNVMAQLETIVNENNAVIEDCIEGCLLDHLLYVTESGYIAFIETYVNSNMSTYTVYETADVNEIEAIWDPIAAAAIE